MRNRKILKHRDEITSPLQWLLDEIATTMPQSLGLNRRRSKGAGRSHPLVRFFNLSRNP